MSEQKNILLAVILSTGVLFAFNFFAPKPEAQCEAPKKIETIQEVPKTAEFKPRNAVIAKSPRIAIDSKTVYGSLNLKGARFDDLALLEYKQSTAKNSPAIVLLSPDQSAEGYFADFTWQAEDKSIELPNADTLWQADSDLALTPEHPVVLTWKNPQGLEFKRTIHLDNKYLFTIKDEVTNTGDKALSLAAGANIVRVQEPKTGGYYILHEGPLGVFNGRLQEIAYDKVKNEIFESKGGWIGITDKYWLVSLVAPQDESFKGEFSKVGTGCKAGFSNQWQTLESKQTITQEHHLFAGAKKLSILDDYAARLGFAKFDLAVDFGYLYFLTKPLFYILDFFHNLFGNFGLAILALTVVVKLAFFPLAQKSNRSLSAMKGLQPKINKIKEKYADDKVKMNQALMELYKTQKINPAGGCLPLLIQAPVFFCLYKVLFVTLEMRHAPFYGWIHDLSAPDPVLITNLFGLLPFDPPGFLTIGVWPVLMGLSMYIQQKMSPQPADPAQAKAMLFMPLFLIYFLGSFPAGLVIYWTWNNILSIAQQWLILRKS